MIKQVNQWYSANVGYVISKLASAPADTGSIDFQIIDDRGKVNSTMTLNKDNNWSYTSGTSIPDGWELRVSSVNGYPIGGSTANSEQNVTLVNTHVPEKISIPVKKVWDDDANHDSKRPESITVHLMKTIDHQTSEVKEVTITGTGVEWTYTFTDLPKNEDGKLITYTITEERAEGYIEPVITGDMNKGFTITNSRGYKLPDTGGSGTIRYTALGILCILSSVVLFILNRKNSLEE